MTVLMPNIPQKNVFGANHTCGTKSHHKISGVISSGESQVSRSLHTKGLILFTVILLIPNYVE